jgi:hypothetical protein
VGLIEQAVLFWPVMLAAVVVVLVVAVVLVGVALEQGVRAYASVRVPRLSSWGPVIPASGSQTQ